MFKNTQAFSSFSSDDIAKAKQFYGETLGLKITEDYGSLMIDVAGGGQVLIYPKDNHEPASFTVLNFSVEDINKAAQDLAIKGVSFEKYEGEIETDEIGIHRGKSKGEGPDIAWFKDPAGNILSILSGA